MKEPGKRFLAVGLGAILVWPLAAFSADAPTSPSIVGWRGDGTGLYLGAHPPIQWDAGKGQNIRWQTKVGKGQSSPVVAAGRMFCTVEPETLLCLEATGGKLLWSRDNSYASLPAGTKTPEDRPPTSPNCGYATPTPVTDGNRVYAVFGSGIAASYDLKGNRQWVRYLDQPQASQYGRSASPVLTAGRLLVSLSGLTALDPLTGETLWDAPAALCSFGTPALARIGDVELAVTSQGDCVGLSDGRTLATKLAGMKYTSPLVVDDVVYFADVPAAAYKLTEQADHTIQPKKLWENDDVEGEFYSSPVCHEGILYCVANEGLFFAIDAQTGETIYQKELDIRSATGRFGAGPANVYPSLTLVGKHLLLSNDVGETLVLKLGREYQEVSRNSLARGCGASPAPTGPFLFLRGAGDVFCIGDNSP